MLLYVIKYTWPDGKVRYRTENRVCRKKKQAQRYPLIEAAHIVKHLSRDAKLVWDIKTEKVRVKK